MTRRAAAALAVAALVAIALVLLGRLEASRHADRENDGIADVRDAVGALDSRTLSGFRFLAKFQCLTYRRGATQFALELCVDRDGRVVEAIDRRSGKTRYWSLREDPGRAAVRVERPEVERLIVRMCPTCSSIFERDEDRADA